MNKRMRIKYIICIFLFCRIIFDINPSCLAFEPADEKRACWISYIDIGEQLCDLNKKQFRKKVGKMYDTLVCNNINTVIVHVRAMGDSMYPSKYYPWSRYIKSDGKRPGYNPLSIMIEEARRRNLKFEAWINPYRLSMNDATTDVFKSTKHYKKYKKYIIEYKNADGENCLSLDPSKQKAIDIIMAGVSEIVRDYDVDGIHFDDYFYVDGMSDNFTPEDKKRYVNSMLSQVYAGIKEINPECVLGISPAGNIGNARQMGADIDRWLSVPGYIDYIMPQIYWSNEYITEGEAVKMFDIRCKEWMELNKLQLPIYVGLALYRVGEYSNIDTGWSKYEDNISRQYIKARREGYNGYALFRYRWMEEDISYAELGHLNRAVIARAEIGILLENIWIN